MKHCWLFIIIALLSGCATKPPLSISRIPPASLSIAEVQANPVHFTGSVVRWGGQITQVENRAEQTWIEVVSRVLAKDGKPQMEGRSDGRFIVSLAGFADPVVYREGYLLTVVGTIEQLVKRSIGEYDYDFPVVVASGSHLWKVEPETEYQVYPPPWWYYEPWPYYRPYPYYPRRHH